VNVTILTGEPVVEVIAEPRLDVGGITKMMRWVQSRRPECMPEEYDEYQPLQALLPHPLEEYATRQSRKLTDAELLVELAGRKCYDSWGLKAGKKTNAEYIANTQAGDIPHASIMYHAKFTFFIAGVSRRVSHELIRNYVGADRDEEGSPSQESTRYVEHAGFYVAHPNIVGNELELRFFKEEMQTNYGAYNNYIGRRTSAFKCEYGQEPKSMDRKRIYESASPYLAHACETSWIWTTNAIAMAKLLKERGNEAADLEFQRLAHKWARVCVANWPNLFCQPHVRELAAE
jgi:thymidylate synthase (FAD)